MWFDGEGAYRFGGRWNTPGTRLMYASGTVSLAILEVLVHLEEEEMMSEYSLATVEFDERVVADISDYAEIPPNLTDAIIPPETQAIGDKWARSRISVVLKVPSVIVRGEYNYLINVEHENFSKVKLGPPEPFIFDYRLARKGKER